MKHNWEYKRLGDVCSFERGVTYSKDDESEFESDVVILRSNNIDLESSSLNFSDLKYLNSCFQIKESKKLKANTILICMSNGSLAHLGKTAFVPQNYNMAFGGFMGLIIPESQNPKYLSYVLRSPIYYNFLDSLNRGANIRNLQFSKLSKLHIPVPPMETQQQIVAELDQINNLIAKNRELLSQLDALTQSLFYDTFGDPISNPKGWDVSKIGAISSVQTGATPSREIEANFCGEIPWVKTTEVQNCNILNTAEHISEDAMENSNCKIFPIDTILVAMYGQGKTRGQIARLKIEACTNQACAAILPSTTLHPSFLFSFLLASYEPLRSVAVGCNQKNLNLSLIKNYPIFLPPLAMQEEFAAKVEAIEAQKAKVEAEIAELQTLLDARMDYWFN